MSVGRRGRNELRVMSFNIENGGYSTNRTAGDFAREIALYDPDIVVFQETWWRPEPEPAVFDRNTAEEAATQLGMHFMQAEIPWGVGIASKLPFAKVFDVSKVCGVLVDMGGGQLLNVFGVHCYDWPNYHFGLCGVEYYGMPMNLSPEESVALSWERRRSDFEDVFAFADPAWDILIVGDFNETSHRDRASNLHWAGGLPVPWRTTQFLEERGFVDACRALYPDSEAQPMFTNQVRRKVLPHFIPQRIDFIFARTARTLGGVTHFVTHETDVSDHFPIIADYPRLQLPPDAA